MCEQNTYFCDSCGKYLFTGTVKDNGDCVYDYKNAPYKEIGEKKYICEDCFQVDLFTDYEDDSLREWTSGCTRRPYYRLIGKPVTKEQALEVIARTDRFWSSVAEDELFEKVKDQFVYTYSPMNAYWFYNLYPSQHGFVKPNGNIYGDGITVKWPEVNELLEDLVNLAVAFPSLDFVMAVTDWDEIPPLAWEIERHEPWRKPELWKAFLAELSIVFHVCGGRVKVMSKKTGRRLYEEYEVKYLDKNDMTFYNGYAHDKKILTCDENYMRRMFDYYKLDGKEVEGYLQRTKEYYR